MRARGAAPPGAFTGVPPRAVTPLELSAHNTATDCWVAIRGAVFDVTHYGAHHPGGAGALIKVAGTDATVAFNAAHSYVSPAALLAAVTIGWLQQDDGRARTSQFVGIDDPAAEALSLSSAVAAPATLAHNARLLGSAAQLGAGEVSAWRGGAAGHATVGWPGGRIDFIGGAGEGIVIFAERQRGDAARALALFARCANLLVPTTLVFDARAGDDAHDAELCQLIAVAISRHRDCAGRAIVLVDDASVLQTADPCVSLVLLPPPTARPFTSEVISKLHKEAALPRPHASLLILVAAADARDKWVESLDDSLRAVFYLASQLLSVTE